MRTAGVLQMDTPLPDGRIVILPKDIQGGGSIANANNTTSLAVTGANVTLFGSFNGMLLRYGMSDDAQQQFGKGAPSGGYQGAQGQAVGTLTPFTTPYGQSGRPPYSNVRQLLTPNGRPKGLMPTAVSVVYSVTGGPATAFSFSINKTAFNVGQVPTGVVILNSTNLPLQTATTQIMTTPIPANAQNFLADPFSVLNFIMGTNAGAATINIFGIFLDVSFNYN